MTEKETQTLPHQEFEQQIISKAQADEEFKQALLADPRAALAQMGVILPDGLELKVVEEAPSVMYLVLPCDPSHLSDDQLDEITGGGWWDDAWNNFWKRINQPVNSCW